MQQHLLARRDRKVVFGAQRDALSAALGGTAAAEEALALAGTGAGFSARERLHRTQLPLGSDQRGDAGEDDPPSDEGEQEGAMEELSHFRDVEGWTPEVLTGMSYNATDSPSAPWRLSWRSDDRVAPTDMDDAASRGTDNDISSPLFMDTQPFATEIHPEGGSVTVPLNIESVASGQIIRPRQGMIYCGRG